MIVVDASVVVALLVGDESDRAQVQGRLTGEELAAPELIDLEVLSALRRQVPATVSPDRAQQCIEDLQDLPVERAPHGPLLDRCWELRDNVTPYDAAYVALAEMLEVPLLTADRRLAAAPGARCDVEVLRSEP